MDTGQWRYITLNSSQKGQTENTPADFTNILAESVGSSSKRMQVALLDCTLDLKVDVASASFLVFADCVVPSVIVGGELTSLLRTAHCPISGRSTYEPVNLMWVDASGTGTSLNHIQVQIYDAEPTAGADPKWVLSTNLVDTSTTLMTLVFREVD
jgi:hypothetical protein